MAGVQASNIFIMNVVAVYSTAKNNLRFQVHVLNAKDESDLLQLVRVRSQDHHFAQSAETSSALSTFKIFWNLTVALQPLKYSSATIAYDSLTAQIMAATTSGSLAASLASLDQVYSNVSVVNVFFAVLPPTMTPTPAAVGRGSSEDTPTSGTASIGVVVGVVAGVILCAGVAVCLFMIRRTKPQKIEKRNMVMASQAAARESLPLPAYYPKNTTVKYADNPVRFQRQPRVTWNAQTSYL